MNRDLRLTGQCFKSVDLKAKGMRLFNSGKIPRAFHASVGQGAEPTGERLLFEGSDMTSEQGSRPCVLTVIACR